MSNKLKKPSVIQMNNMFLNVNMTINEKTRPNLAKRNAVSPQFKPPHSKINPSTRIRQRAFSPELEKNT